MKSHHFVGIADVNVVVVKGNPKGPLQSLCKSFCLRGNASMLWIAQNVDLSCPCIGKKNVTIGRHRQKSRNLEILGEYADMETGGDCGPKSRGRLRVVRTIANRLRGERRRQFRFLSISYLRAGGVCRQNRSAKNHSEIQGRTHRCIPPEMVFLDP